MNVNEYIHMIKDFSTAATTSDTFRTTTTYMMTITSQSTLTNYKVLLLLM